MTRDKWPNYVCCVLTVRQELIDSDRPLVQQIVNHVLSAGAWLETAQANRDLAAPTSRRGPPCSTSGPRSSGTCSANPRDRVTYADLRLIRSELDELMEAALEAGIIRQRIPYERYVDDSFQRERAAGGHPCSAVGRGAGCRCWARWPCWSRSGTSPSVLSEQPHLPHARGRWRAGLVDLARQGLLLKHIVASLFRVTCGYLLAAALGDSARHADGLVRGARTRS